MALSWEFENELADGDWSDAARKDAIPSPVSPEIDDGCNGPHPAPLCPGFHCMQVSDDDNMPLFVSGDDRCPRHGYGAIAESNDGPTSIVRQQLIDMLAREFVIPLNALADAILAEFVVMKRYKDADGDV